MTQININIRDKGKKGLNIAIADIKAGNIKKFNSIDDFFKDLGIQHIIND